MKRYFVASALIFVLAGGAIADECRETERRLQSAFETFLSVGQLHNCHLEVLKQKDESFIHYVVYARDLYRCSHPSLACHEAEFEFSIPDTCMEEDLALRSVRATASFDYGNRNLRTFMDLKVNSMGQPFSLVMGSTEMRSAQRINYVKCEPEIFGGRL